MYIYTNSNISSEFLYSVENPTLFSNYVLQRSDSLKNVSGFSLVGFVHLPGPLS